MKIKKMLLPAIFILTLYAVALAQQSPSADKNMLADRHINEQGIICAECHNEAEPKSKPLEELCLNCHGSYEELAIKTVGEEMNPHDNHFGPMPCNSCHMSHIKSILFCDECHSFGYETP